MTKIQYNILFWALTDAKASILGLTDGKGVQRREAKEDSPVVVDRLCAALSLLQAMSEH